MVVAVLVAAGGAYVFVEDRGCEIACGSSSEQTIRSILFAATSVGGMAAGAFAFRRLRLACVLILVIALVCFVVALGQGLSNLN